MGAFRVLVVDDHPVFRFGVCTLLRSHAGWEVCGEATDGRDAVQKCSDLKPDLLILDICLPILNGVEAARQIMKRNPAQRILVLTDVDSEKIVGACLEVGVRGWVFKSDGTDELTAAVETLQRGKDLFSPRVSNMIIDGCRGRSRVTPAATTVGKLSPREREVVQLVAEGKTSKEVAMILGVSMKTVETHRSNLMRKLNLHSIIELVWYAVRNEFIHVQLPAVLYSRNRAGSGRTNAYQSAN